MTYHSKGLGKNKAIKKERKKPLPIGLMLNDSKRIESRRDNIPKDTFIGTVISLSEDDC